MNTIARMMLVAMLALGSGCAKSDWIQQTLVTVDVTGAWVGWLGNGSLGAEVRLDLHQEGQKVRGSLRSLVRSNYGFEFPNGRLDGDVHGDVFSFKMTDGGVTGEMTVNGDEMQGYANAGSRTPISLRRVGSTAPPRPPQQ
jgi:hypothetical protein